MKNSTQKNKVVREYLVDLCTVLTKRLSSYPSDAFDTEENKKLKRIFDEIINVKTVIKNHYEN